MASIVCATQQLCSSETLTDVGAEAIARALEKNTTLQTLHLYSESVLFCCFGVVGLVWFFVDVGCCWVVSGVDGAGVWR